MNFLIEAHGEGHFETTQTISTTVDQDYTTVADPAAAADLVDIYRVLYLRVTLDGTRIDMKRSNAEGVDLEDPNNNFAWTLSYPPRWHFREHLDQRFIWSRTPQDVHVVTVHYVPYFVFFDFSSEGAALEVMSDATNHVVRSHMGWDEWLVLDCAIKAMKRQAMPAEDWQALMLEQQAIEGEIRAGAQKRTDSPKHIRKRFFQEDEYRRAGSRFWGL